MQGGAVAVLRGEAGGPEAGRLVGVAVGGDHEVFGRVPRVGGVGPAGVAGVSRRQRLGALMVGADMGAPGWGGYFRVGETTCRVRGVKSRSRACRSLTRLQE
jgi:hypothetical protein